MKTASELIKQAGLKSTSNVAYLNGISTDTVQRAFKNNPESFEQQIEIAVYYTARRFKKAIEKASAESIVEYKKQRGEDV